jgi:hypothetical protein
MKLRTYEPLHCAKDQGQLIFHLGVFVSVIACHRTSAPACTLGAITG